MAMTTGGKVVVAGLVGVGGYFALTSSSSAKGKGPRAPYKKKIPTVPNQVPWTTVDEAICQCFQADNEIESVALVNCALARIWPDVPWPAQPNDHVSVMRVWQAVGNRVAIFMATEDKIAACAIVEDDDDDDTDVDPPPPPADVNIEDYYGDGPNRFARVTQTHNHNPDNTAHYVYGLPVGSANIGRAMMCMSNVGFNLLFYSRKRNAGAFGSANVTQGLGGHQNYDIGPAWMPWNNRVITAAVTGTKLKRNVGWSGNGPAPGGDRAFGSPWMPPTTITPAGILVCSNADPWAPENNPPPEVLAKLGWSLDEMKAAWLAGNP